MKYLLLLSICFYSAVAYNQHWGRSTQSNFTNEAMDIEVDSQGNSYVVGYYSGNTSFDSATALTTFPGNQNIYVSKYNSSGSLIWVKYFGSNHSDRGVNLAIDNNDQILVTGTFHDVVDFGGVLLQSSLGSKDIFVLKLDEFGNVLWARKEGGDMSENVYSITVDNLNNVILTGQFEGTSQIGASTFTSYIDPVTLAPSYDLFLSKYDPNGNPIWVIIGQADYEERGLAVSVDSQNNIFMTGQFSDTLDFAGIQIANSGYNVGFVAKISPGGSINWVNMIRAGFVMAYDIEVNAFDEVVIIGDYLGNFIYSDGAMTSNISNSFFKKIFCLKIGNSGVFIWGQALGSDNRVSARALSITSSKDIFITGFFDCFWSELRGSQTAYYNSVGFEDAYLWKIDNTGYSEYVRQFGGKTSDKGRGIAIVNSNEAVICGSFMEDLNLMGDLSSSYLTSVSSLDLTVSTYSEPYHYYLSGDMSINSFVLNAVDLNTPQYNYFDNQPFDSLTGNILSSADSLHGCIDEYLVYNDSSYTHLGPAYNYLWSNGGVTDTTLASYTGLYTIDVGRIDGCSSFTDSIIVYPRPDLPLLNDNLGLAINEVGPSYYNYHFCFPDSVNIWFSNLDPSYSLEIDHSLLPSIFDTLSHVYASGTAYDVIVSDSFCYNYGEFNIFFDYASPHDIIPYMVMVDEVDYNDSLTICYGDQIIFQILDSLENPTGLFNQLPSDPLHQYTWSVSSIADFEGQFSPSSTGWYTIDFFGIVGYDNLCGVDTSHYYVTDSFYIEVLPLPTAFTTIYGDSLCPDGSVYLALSDTILGFSWSGPSIVWTSFSGDSVQVTIEGEYSYSGILVDSVSGCYSDISFDYYVHEKASPGILLSPLNGLICPNDSLYMSVQTGYVSYNWNGPSGDSLSTTFEHIDIDQGFYFCIMEDVDGCFLTSNIVELREYITPFLTVSPTNVLCLNDSVLIEAIIQDTLGINWTVPISSTSPSVYVSQPGWYVCELTQCGITIIDSVLIIDGSFNLSITTTDSVLCYGDTVVLSAPPGLVSYNWSDGTIGLPSIEITNQGSYWLYAINSYLCDAFSDTININFIEESEPPNILDTVLCGGGNLLISDSIPTSWYDIDTNWLSHSIDFEFLNLINDTSLLVAYDVVECPNNYVLVNIVVVDSIISPIIYGDSLFCLYDSLILTLDTTLVGEHQWFLNGGLLSDSSEIVITSLILNSPDTIWLVQSNMCYADSAFLIVSPLFAELINIVDDSIVSCGDNSLEMMLDSNSIDSIVWQGFFGSIYTDTLELSSYSEGYIFAQGIGNNGCPSTIDSIYLLIDSLQSTTYVIDNTVCENGMVSIGVASNADSVSWSSSSGGINNSLPEFTIAANDSTVGWYFVELLSYNGCAIYDSIYLTSHYDNAIPMFNDTTICEGDFISLDSQDTSVLIDWGGLIVNDSISFYSSQELIYTVVDNFGCTFIDTVYINVIGCYGEIPNVITANGDGVNDYFVVDKAQIYPNSYLIITNRWGDVVFEENNYQNNFNGEGLNDGVYFYVFYHNYLDPITKKNSGALTIIR